MTERTPKLDRVWMEALGFTLEDRPNVAHLFWHNKSLDLSVHDLSAEPKWIALEVIRKAGIVAVRKQAVELRNVLLPALGLEEKNEYDNLGYTTRTFIGPEE